MTLGVRRSASSAVRLVPSASRVVVSPLVRFRLGVADRALVDAGAEIHAGDPIIERAREPFVVRVRLPAGAAAPTPGALLERGSRLGPEGRRAVRLETRGRVLFVSPAGVLHLAAGRGLEVVASPLAGTVEESTRSAIAVRARGFGIPGILASGEPVSGRLVVRASGPDADLRASSIDVGAAGSIVLAGARIDIEALTRARATGARGVVTGGIAGKDLRTLEASEARHGTALHPRAPFGLVVLRGYGRQPVPGPVWECLAGAVDSRSEAGIVLDPPMLVLDAPPPTPTPTRRVSVVGGAHAGLDAQLIEVLGTWRHPAGVHLPSARVSLMGRRDGGGDGGGGKGGASDREAVVPLAELERFE